MADSYSRLSSLKRSSVSLNLSFTQDMCTGTSQALSWSEMKCAFVYMIKNEPPGNVKNISPLGLERDDTVKTGRILLINKGRLFAKG